MDSFKDLLTETVGQIKRANEYLAEQQMKEIKKLKYNEPRKFKKKANEDQFQRIHSAEFCGHVAYQAGKKKKTTLSTLNNRSSPVGTPASTSSSQMQPQPLMSNVPVFRLLVDPVSGPVLPVESVPVTRRWTSQTCQTPKWLDEGQQSGAVYSNLVLNFLSGKA